MTSYSLDMVFPGATQDANSVTIPKGSLATLVPSGTNSAEAIIAAFTKTSRDFYTVSRREADPGVLVSAPLSNRYLASNNQGQFNQLVWNLGLEFYFPFDAPAFDANVFDGGAVVIGPGDPEPDPFGQPDFRWQQLISDAIDSTGRRHVWILLPVPVLTLPDESDGDGWTIVNDTDTDTAIAGTDITIPAGSSAYLIFTGGVWESALLAPPAPQLTFQPLTTASNAIAPDLPRYVWITEPVPTLALPASQPGDGFFVVNASEENSEVPGDAPEDPAIILAPQTTTLFLRTAQGWQHQVIGGSSAGVGGGGPVINVDISGSDFAVSLDPDVLFTFGTNFGDTTWSNPLDGVRCAVSASGSSPVDLILAADRGLNRFDADNAAGGWIALDFDPSGAGHRVNLNAFAWQHISGFSGIRLQSFVVEVGDGADLAGAAWTAVATISDPNFLPDAAGSWSAVRPLATRPAPYRFIRFRMTGPDSSGGNNLVGSEVMLGGEIHRGDL